MASAQLGRPTDRLNRNSIPDRDVADIVEFLKALSRQSPKGTSSGA
jgi:hypothetical protein